MLQLLRIHYFLYNDFRDRLLFETKGMLRKGNFKISLSSSSYHSYVLSNEDQNWHHYQPVKSYLNVWHSNTVVEIWHRLQTSSIVRQKATNFFKYCFNAKNIILLSTGLPIQSLSNNLLSAAMKYKIHHKMLKNLRRNPTQPWIHQVIYFSFLNMESTKIYFTIKVSMSRV